MAETIVSINKTNPLTKNQTMPVRDGSVPPMLMFRSFLTIACGVVGQWCIVAFTILAVMSFFFPEYQAAIQEGGEAVADGQAFVPMPRTMLCMVTGISAALCVLLGIFIGLTAPFGRFVHTVFLAVIVAMTYLSGSMAAPPEKKFVQMTFLLVIPPAILFGGYLINRKMANYDLAGREEPAMLGGDDLS